MKPTYSNDRKAPRMRKAKFSTKIISKELWKEFINTFPEHKDMPWEKFYRAWLDIAETTRTEATTNPLGVKLGSYTGELKVRYIGPEFKPEDFKASQQLGVKIIHSNLISNGKAPVIRWERRWAARFNKMLNFFGFEPHREMTKIKTIHSKANPDKIRVARIPQRLKKDEYKKTDNKLPKG